MQLLIKSRIRFVRSSSMISFHLRSTSKVLRKRESWGKNPLISLLILADSATMQRIYAEKNKPYAICKRSTAKNWREARKVGANNMLPTCLILTGSSTTIQRIYAGKNKPVLSLIRTVQWLMVLVNRTIKIRLMYIPQLGV